MRWVLTAFAVILAAVVPVYAQDTTDTQTFTSEDGSFTFEYPNGWFVEIVNPEYGPNAHLALDNLPLDQRFEVADSLNLQISLPKKPYEFMFSRGDTPREMVAGEVGVSGEAPTIDFATPSASGTPQPLQLPSKSPQVNEVVVNGIPGAYSYQVMRVMGMDASQLFAVIDLGNGYWVTVTAISYKGGLETIQKYEPTILEILQSMRYTPPPAVYSGNPELPQVYSGLVGTWQRGSIEFYYPEDWYVSNSAFLLISNKAGNLQMSSPDEGQFVATVLGVSETRAASDPTEVLNQCDVVNNKDLTARQLVEKILGRLTSAQLEQMKAAGVTITQPEVTVVDGIEIVYIRAYQGGFETLQLFIDLGDGQIPSMNVTAHQGEMAQFEDRLFAVAATFQYTPKACDE